MANDKPKREKVGDGEKLNKCCVCGGFGINAKQQDPPLLLKNIASILPDPITKLLWPIHKSYQGVMALGERELPVKIHAHFPQVPKTRLLDTSSRICSTCFQVVYNVLQLEKQLIQMKAQINVELESNAEKEKARQLKSSSREKKCKVGVNKIIQSEDDLMTATTRLRRRKAFSGLSKEIIQAELEVDEFVSDGCLTGAFLDESDNQGKPLRRGSERLRRSCRLRYELCKTDTDLSKNKRKKRTNESRDEVKEAEPPREIPDNETFFCCPRCCSSFKKEDFETFKAHLNEQCLTKKKFPCQICGHIYINKNVLLYHMESVHEKPHPRSKLLHEDNWPEDKESAENIGKSTGSWKCWICFYESHKKSFWLTHMTRVHPSAKGLSITCEFCQFRFAKRHHLKDHLREVHPDSCGYTCEKCDRKFLNKNSQHECSKIFCDICEQTFDTWGSKSKHMLQHSEFRPHKCSFCSKTFQRSEYLKLHLRTHNDDRPYECEFCSKRFRSKPHYNNHRRIHTEEKPYMCFRCGESYRSPQALYNHMKTHSEKDFSCPICDKMFRTAYDVERHKIIHLGLKPFECTVCHKAFNRRSNCLAHERNHARTSDQVKSFNCSTCAEVFGSSRKLEDHTNKVHRKKMHSRKCDLKKLVKEDPDIEYTFCCPS